ncbi:GreA/GreB family elongation factor [Pelagibacterium mangrovi]|uniref:GreA/GreB family elongation factor n=1 Tax=Pelagibacterium mangrovi TaxID=3119828 RepID=UPI002FC5DEDB
MSRAFVKETDDLPEIPAPERAISSAPNYVTRRGAALIEAEVDRLMDLFNASSDADGELLQPELRYWESRRASMELIEREPDDDTVGFGMEVTIERNARRQTIRIVGEDEADPKEGYISWTSPLARAIEDSGPGESVEFEAGGRIHEIEILAVRPI